MQITLIITLVILIVCTITDIRHRLIYNKVLLPYFLFGVFICMFENKSVYMIVSVLLFLLFLFLKELGEGDRKLLAILPLYLQEHTPYFFFVLSIVYLFLYAYQRKRKIKKVAFAPYILVSYCISLLVKMTGV